MVCSACGAPEANGVNFCARCGAPAQAAEQPFSYSAPPPPVAGHYGVPYGPPLRVQRNLQALGILWYVFAAYRVVAGLIGMFVIHSFANYGWPFTHQLYRGDESWGQHGMWGFLVPVIGAATVAAAGLAAVAGWSLQNRKPWARTLAIIAAVLSLVKFPVGTALGIYTLWVLAPAESGMEWETIADPS